LLRAGLKLSLLSAKIACSILPEAAATMVTNIYREDTRTHAV